MIYIPNLVQHHQVNLYTLMIINKIYSSLHLKKFLTFILTFSK